MASRRSERDSPSPLRGLVVRLAACFRQKLDLVGMGRVSLDFKPGEFASIMGPFRQASQPRTRLPASAAGSSPAAAKAAASFRAMLMVKSLCQSPAKLR